MTTDDARKQPLTFLEDAYARSHRQLRATAARFVANDAEDVVHDVFVRALEKAASFRHDATPRTWLHRITVNTCIDHWRKRKPVESFEAASFRSHAYTPDPCAGAVLRAAFKCLSPLDRRLCLLRFVTGFSYREIANRLNMPEGTAKRRVSSARARLRREIGVRPWTR
jgi:RNA polymerase sigma-70 factor (ECF subfamily)